VTWTDPVAAAALRDALAARKIENVMLVSAFLAAAALAQAVGSATNYAHTALLFVEPDTATLAVVDTSDGSIADVRRQTLPEDDDEALTKLAAMVSDVEALEARPEGVFVIGSGVDIPQIKPALEAATSLPVSAPEEPATALARGAALASANAPLFASSTAALAYAQDPGTGAVDPYAVAPGYFEVSDDARQGGEALAYSAVPDEEADAYTAFADQQGFATGTFTSGTFAGVTVGRREHGRRPFWLVGSAVAAIFVVGVVALAVALAIGIRPTVGVRPNPGHNLVAPAAPAPAPAPAAPAPAAPAPAPAPAAPTPAPAAPAPAPAAPAPAPAAPAPAAPAPVPVAPVPAPAAPVPAPAAPAPVPVAPAPVPAAPAPVPAGPVPVAPPVAPAAPVPAGPVVPPVVPIIPLLPQIFSPPVQGPPMEPWGGDHGGGGWGHGGGFGPPGGGGWGHGGGFGPPGGGGFGGGHGGFGGFGGGFGGRR
jgi:hypothetical protein